MPDRFVRMLGREDVLPLGHFPLKGFAQLEGLFGFQPPLTQINPTKALLVRSGGARY